MDCCKEENVPHVLAVDDNLIDRKLVEKLLKNSSCKVTTAENGMRALEYLGNNGPKVNMIITDYCMPGMTGYELLQKIKESSNLKEVPVVIMSSENIPTRINEYNCLEMYTTYISVVDQIKDLPKMFRNGSTNVHAEAAEVIGCEEPETSISKMIIVTNHYD